MPLTVKRKNNTLTARIRRTRLDQIGEKCKVEDIVGKIGNSSCRPENVSAKDHISSPQRLSNY